MHKLIIILSLLLISSTAFAGGGGPNGRALHGWGGPNGRTIVVQPGEGRSVQFLFLKPFRTTVIRLAD